MKIDFILSIWDDDHIRRLGKNMWQCFWCNNIFQGINSPKSLDHLHRTKVVNIKNCYDSMRKSHWVRYQDINNFKDARSCVIQDCSENIKSSISSLHNESYVVIKSTIHRNCQSITLENDMNISEISSFRTASNKTTESNAIN